MAVLSPALDPAQPTGLLQGGRFDQRNEDLAVVNPYTGEEIARVAVGGPDDVGAAVADALGHLPPPPPSERAEVLERAARLVADRAETFARTICLEAGKPMKQARGEAARCVDTLTFSAVEARSLAGEVVPMESSGAGAGKLGIILREPVGVVGAISPFNFPFNLVAHKVAPALAAGCAVVLKPASQTPLSALLLAELEAEAGLPAGWLNVLVGPASEIGDVLVEDERVRLISFTGSAEVGWKLRERAARKKVLLELGNATPLIVEADGDVEDAASKAAANAFSFAGQSCISIQRVYVARAVYDDFVARFLPKVEALRPGDPGDDDTDVGPVIDEGARERILTWIDEAKSQGADILTGGETTDDGVIRPTVLTNITPEMKVSCLEVFGPVCTVSPYDSVEEAFDLANGTEYGLQAGIFTSNVKTALAAGAALEFGGVLVNEAPTFRADQMPYGGVKASGNTKEGPPYSVREMTEERLIVLSR
jgi:acyl-CoA reductase-like NAD-dependent aldehyde dehydrogenase